MNGCISVVNAGSSSNALPATCHYVLGSVGTRRRLL